VFVLRRRSASSKRRLGSSSLAAKLNGIVLGRVDDSLNWFELVERTDSDVLVVAFAGGAVLIGGIPLGEFGATIAALGHSALLISDPFQSFYMQDPELKWQGVAYWRKRIQTVSSRRYKAIVLVGNCMGGAAALLLADLATRVVAISPQTTLSNSRSWYWINSLRMPSALRNSFEDLVDDGVRQCPHVAVYFSTSKDYYMTKYLRENVHLRVQALPGDRVGSSVVSYLKSSGQLVPFLKAHIEAARAGRNDLIEIA
jgi:hypothetical protein